VPKAVDHDRRRIEIIHATWRTTVRDGWDAAMVAITRKAGSADVISVLKTLDGRDPSCLDRFSGVQK